jgi:hypothetical protein
MGALPGGLACHLLRDASTLPQPELSLHIIEAEDPVGELGHGFQVPVQYRDVQEDAPPRGLLHGLGNWCRVYSWPFRTSGDCAPLSGKDDGSPPGWSAARTEVKALLTFSSIALRSSRLRMPERMPVIKRILNCCKWGLPFRARSISSGAMRTLNDGEQGDGGQELEFHR